MPIRRLAEHLACLLSAMAALFMPLALLAPHLYAWMDPPRQTTPSGQSRVLNRPFFYVRAGLLFAIWMVLSWRLRYWSLRQDESGAAGAPIGCAGWPRAASFCLP